VRLRGWARVIPLAVKPSMPDAKALNISGPKSPIGTTLTVSIFDLWLLWRLQPSPILRP
jgi:hypothetical protein